MEYNKNIFISNLNLLMKEKGIKISELESECNLSQGYFSRFKLSDANAAPNINLVTKLCSIFDISIDVLLCVNCSTIYKSEITILNFIYRISNKTFYDGIHWTKYNLLSSYDDIINSGISNLFSINKEEQLFFYSSKFSEINNYDENSATYVYKDGDDYYALTFINKSQSVFSPIYYSELYYIHNDEVHKIAATSDNHQNITNALNNLYESILKEQNSIKIDDEVIDAISNFK